MPPLCLIIVIDIPVIITIIMITTRSHLVFCYVYMIIIRTPITTLITLITLIFLITLIMITTRSPPPLCDVYIIMIMTYIIIILSHAKQLKDKTSMSKCKHV